jgi:hypothetical protein
MQRSLKRICQPPCPAADEVLQALVVKTAKWPGDLTRSYNRGEGFGGFSVGRKRERVEPSRVRAWDSQPVLVPVDHEETPAT